MTPATLTIWELWMTWLYKYSMQITKVMTIWHPCKLCRVHYWPYLWVQKQNLIFDAKYQITILLGWGICYVNVTEYYFKFLLRRRSIGLVSRRQESTEIAMVKKDNLTKLLGVKYVPNLELKIWVLLYSLPISQMSKVSFSSIFNKKVSKLWKHLVQATINHLYQKCNLPCFRSVTSHVVIWVVCFQMPHGWGCNFCR